jgi:hypothetical protein
MRHPDIARGELQVRNLERFGTADLRGIAIHLCEDNKTIMCYASYYEVDDPPYSYFELTKPVNPNFDAENAFINFFRERRVLH